MSIIGVVEELLIGGGIEAFQKKPGNFHELVYIRLEVDEQSSPKP